MPRPLPSPKVIGIVGSRRRDRTEDFEACCEAFLKLYQKGDKIVSGGCPKGGDRFAEQIARHKGCTIIIHHADWEGPAKRGAGFVRNTDIARDCDVLIALVAPDRKGGTEDTVKKALKLGKQVILA
jgi:hypothetical protein